MTHWLSDLTFLSFSKPLEKINFKMKHTYLPNYVCCYNMTWEKFGEVILQQANWLSYLDYKVRNEQICPGLNWIKASPCTVKGMIPVQATRCYLFLLLLKSIWTAVSLESLRNYLQLLCKLAFALFQIDYLECSWGGMVPDDQSWSHCSLSNNLSSANLSFFTIFWSNDKCVCLPHQK